MESGKKERKKKKGDCGKETMRGGRGTSNKTISMPKIGGGQSRGPLVSGPVRAERPSGLFATLFAKRESPFKYG